MSQTQCYCGLAATYETCCQPYHLKKKKPETAEKLMRSRYSAYVAGVIDYIHETNDPSAKDTFDREAAEEWSKQSEWKGLEIVATSKGQSGDVEGEVEFKATYRYKDEDTVHHEVSLFRFGKPGNRWYYVDGKTIQAPLQRSEPKVGRNDPCTCGSGKKSKKCCAA
jgi:SEC-C motif-containing protein